MDVFDLGRKNGSPQSDLNHLEMGFVIDTTGNHFRNLHQIFLTIEIKLTVRNGLNHIYGIRKLLKQEAKIRKRGLLSD